MIEHAKFVAENMMTSGSKMTLTGNTVYDMGIIGGEYDYTDIKFAMFKGDDSIVCCRKRKPIMYSGKRLSEWCGYILKTSIDTVPEFIANFINPWGFFPDVLRRVSRVVGRLVTHPEQWGEMRRSVADALSVVNSDMEMHLGALAAAKHYNDKGMDITYDDIIYLVTFLKQVVWDDNLEPSVTGEWNILYYDITRMLQQLGGMLNSHYIR